MAFYESEVNFDSKEFFSKFKNVFIHLSHPNILRSKINFRNPENNFASNINYKTCVTTPCLFRENRKIWNFISVWYGQSVVWLGCFNYCWFLMERSSVTK